MKPNQTSAIYLRTSTQQQDGARFNVKKLQKEYDKIYFDKGVSGTIAFNKRPEAQKLLNDIQTGTVTSLTVPEISRLGRNTRDVVNTLHEIEKSDIQITIIDLGIQRLNVNGKMNIAYKIIIPLMSTIAELERKAILQRTKEGRQAYVLSGGKLGRPTGSKEKLRTFLQKPKTKQIAKMLHMKKSYRDIEARTGAATSTIKKVKDIMNNKQLPL